MPSQGNTVVQQKIRIRDRKIFDYFKKGCNSRDIAIAMNLNYHLVSTIIEREQMLLEKTLHWKKVESLCHNDNVDIKKLIDITKLSEAQLTARFGPRTNKLTKFKDIKAENLNNSVTQIKTKPAQIPKKPAFSMGFMQGPDPLKQVRVNAIINGNKGKL